MKTEEQIEALAKLDGYSKCESCEKNGYTDQWKRNGGCININNFEYLTSYNEIIPLIKKQSYLTRLKIIEWLDKSKSVPTGITVLESIPAQLAEAILRATNLWKDSDIK